MAKTTKFTVQLNKSLTPDQRDSVVQRFERLFSGYLPEVEIKASGDKVTVTVKEVEEQTRLRIFDVLNKLNFDRFTTDVEQDDNAHLNTDLDSLKEAATAYEPYCPSCGSFIVKQKGDDGFQCDSCGYDWENPGFREVEEFEPELDFLRFTDEDKGHGLDVKHSGVHISNVCMWCAFPTVIRLASSEYYCNNCGTYQEDYNPIDPTLSKKLGENFQMSDDAVGPMFDAGAHSTGEYGYNMEPVQEGENPYPEEQTPGGGDPSYTSTTWFS